MTKALDPEIKGLRAVHRALHELPFSMQKRILEWAVASRLDVGSYQLPPFPPDPEQGGGERDG